MSRDLIAVEAKSLGWQLIQNNLPLRDCWTKDGKLLAVSFKINGDVNYGSLRKQLEGELICWADNRQRIMKVLKGQGFFV